MMNSKHQQPERNEQGSEAPRTAGRRHVSRRAFLIAGAGGAAVASTLAAKPSMTGGLGKLRSVAQLRGGSGTQYDPDLLLLIDRITGGFSVDEYLLAEGMGGYEAYLTDQLDNYAALVGPGNDQDLWDRLTLYDIVDMPASEIRTTYGINMQNFVAEGQTTSIQLMFAVYGKAQLYYRMMQFWNHHLNIDINSSGHQRRLVWPFIRDVILANTMGNFPQLIADSAHGSAMLVYLNNYLNTKTGVDENYARELMELYTLGVDGGYTEADVNNAAKILTGWSTCITGDNHPTGQCVDGPITYDYGDYWFRADRHNSNDTKIVLGQSFGPGGKEEGDQLLAFLTGTETCARFIAGKLCQFFLGQIPSDIQSMVAWTYHNNPVAVGDIPSMLQVILSREVLTNYARPKFRRPFDLVSASLRAVRADLDPEGGIQGNIDLLRSLMSDLNTMGMQPNFWQPPNGPFDSDVWAEGGGLTRWRYLDRMANNFNPDVTDFVVGDLLEDVNANLPGQQAAGLNELLTGGRMSDKEVEAVQDFIGYGSVSDGRLKDALAFALEMPTYQFI